MPANSPYPDETPQEFRRRMAKKLRGRSPSVSKLSQRIRKTRGRMESAPEDRQKFLQARSTALTAALRRSNLERQYGSTKKAQKPVYGDIEGYKPGIVKKAHEYAKSEGADPEKAAKLEAIAKMVHERRQAMPLGPRVQFNEKRKEFVRRPPEDAPGRTQREEAGNRRLGRKPFNPNPGQPTGGTRVPGDLKRGKPKRPLFAQRGAKQKRRFFDV